MKYSTAYNTDYTATFHSAQIGLRQLRTAQYRYGQVKKTTTTQRTDKRTTDFFLIIIILFEKLIIFAK